MQDRADGAIVEGRDAIQNLRSSTTVTNELAQALAALGEELACAQAGAGASPTLRVSVEGTPRELHPILRDDVYRIAREALRNAYRHAQASHIEAEVTYGVREVRLRIRDDGKGIMRERAQQIGSELNLWSEVGAGTEVELRIPGSVAYGPSRRRSFFRRIRKQGSD